MDRFDQITQTYEIYEKLGSGGGGTIYKAFHKRLKKDVVIKVMHGYLKDVLNNRAEADILKKLRHSYLPQVLDYFEENGCIVTVMDYIPGKSFKQLLEEGYRFKQRDVMKWAIQLCEALEYLHSQNPPIIHSDIKPANIMLMPNGSICLIDFNISSYYERDGAHVCGYSDGYSPPEQYILYNRTDNYINESAAALEDATEIIGRVNSESRYETEVLGIRRQTAAPEADRTEILNYSNRAGGISEAQTDILNNRGQSTSTAPTEPVAYSIVNECSDIYSLGAVLYHMLTGVCPGKATGTVTPINTLGNFSDGLVYIISKALQKKPAKRFQTAGQMLKALLSINRLDRRYKNYILVKQITFIFMLVCFTASILSIYYGRLMIRQEKADAFYQKALALYEAGSYDDAAEYIVGELQDDPDINMGGFQGDIYYILGNCYYEKGDYADCADYLQKAVDSDEDNLQYYADYAAALAKSGDGQEAGRVLETAIQKGIADSAVYRIKGEIDLINGEYESGEQNFLNCIKSAGDDYSRMRAYLSCSQLYDAARADQTEDWNSPGIDGSTGPVLMRQLALLQDAKARLPVSMVQGILESLAGTYINCGIAFNDSSFLEDAVSVFNEITTLKLDTYLTHKNLAVLYRQLEDIDSAWKEAMFMLEEYGEDYYIYSLFALLECDRQIAAESTSRDFSKFIDYYNQSVKLYNEQKKKDEVSQDMIPLFNAYNLLLERGWIDEDEVGQ